MSLQLKRAEKRRRTYNETSTLVRIGICKACGRGPRQVTYGDSVCVDNVLVGKVHPHFELMRPFPCVKREDRNALRNQ
jgi:hypothetical protein